MLRYLKAVGVVAGLTLTTNLFGFIREVLLARSFGASAEADTFVTAFTVVSACFLIFTAGTVQSAFMPLYQGLGSSSSAEARWLFWHSAKALGVLLLGVVVLLELGAQWWIAILMPGFSSAQIQSTSVLVRIMAPMVLLFGIGSLLQSVAHAHQRFLGPASIPLLNNFIVIAFLLVVGGTMGMSGLAIAYLIGALLWWIVLVPGTWRYVAGDRAAVDRTTWRSLLMNLAPLLILLGADQVSALIQKSLVSETESGTIAALNYASKLEGLPVGIFAAAISTVFFPALVDAISRGETRAAKDRFMAGLSGILLCSLPAMVVLCLEAESVVRVLFERGSFDSRASELTSAALAAYSLGLLPQGLVVYFNRVYFAAQQTTLPMKVGVLSAGIHVAFCWIAVDVIGYLGIPVGTTLYAIVYAILLLVWMREIVSITLKELTAVMWRPIVASAALAATLLSVHFDSNLWGLLWAILLSGGIYLAMLLILQEPIIFDRRPAISS